MELYTEILLDHYRNPHNAGVINDADIKVHEVNASCGDNIDLYLKIDENKKVEKISFVGSGCTISQASMSMLSDELVGMTLEDIKNISQEKIMDLLKVPVGPGRSKCALLSLAAAKKAAIAIQYNQK